MTGKQTQLRRKNIQDYLYDGFYSSSFLYSYVNDFALTNIFSMQNKCKKIDLSCTVWIQGKTPTTNNNTIICYANVSISFCLKFDHGFPDFSNCLSLFFSLLNKTGMNSITWNFFRINFTDGFTKLKLVILD